MPRPPNERCKVCERLAALSREYGPRRKVYPDPTPKDIFRENITDYDGVGQLGPRSVEAMKRLYVRDNGVNKAIGHICENGHVTLDDDGSYPKQNGNSHVLTRQFPPSVICCATGEVVPTRE